MGKLPENSKYFRLDQWSERDLNWMHSGHLFSTHEEAVAEFERRRHYSPQLRVRVMEFTAQVLNVWDHETPLQWGPCADCKMPLRKGEVEAGLCRSCRRRAEERQTKTLAKD